MYNMLYIDSTCAYMRMMRYDDDDETKKMMI